MSAPGPAFFEQIERDERERRRADARNAHAFCERRFVPLFRDAEISRTSAGEDDDAAKTRDSPRARYVYRARFVVDVRRSNLDNWSVGEVICDHAERIGATAIVMAPHGRGRLREWFVGSACRHCLRRSKTPLVIVRPDYARVRAKQEPEAERGEPHASLVSSAR